MFIVISSKEKIMFIRMNTINPCTSPLSFKGVVKVSLVLDGDTPSNDKKVINSATKQLKAILMKKADTPTTKENNELLRKIYNYFDTDYQIPEEAPEGDARDIFAKVRTGKYGNEVYLVSKDDAALVAKSGKNIGSKKALEKIDESKTGIAQQAKDKYFSVKEEIASRYYNSKYRPNIYLYTIRDKNNIVRLVGVRMTDTMNQVHWMNPHTKTITLNNQYLDNSQKSGQNEPKKPKVDTRQSPAEGASNKTNKNSGDINSSQKHPDNSIKKETKEKKYEQLYFNF